jgi:NADPH2:quinone reductase
VKAIRFHELGGPEVLRLEDVPDPTGPNVIRVRAIGVNFADTRFRLGKYFVRPRFPQIPGMEAAGELVSTGARVMVLGEGAYAELMSAPTIFPMPDGLGFAEAAALPVQGITAHHCLRLAGRLAPGETVLVHAAAGGVGSLAVQIAKLMGAKQVIATAGGPEKTKLARELGADVAIDYRTDDVVNTVKDATGGRGVDVLLEMLGGTDALTRNLACLAPFGRMIVFGAASGDTKGTIEPVALMARNQSVIGYYLTPLLRKPELCAPVLDEVARWVVEKKLRVVVGERLPLAEAAEAHRRMERRDTVGKIVLEP